MDKTTDSVAEENHEEIELFRHGDRTPVELYPNDPWKNASYWPEPFGQLTNIGKQQHYVLGQWLRKRYNSLVSEQYSLEKMYVQSTNVDRTLMSAMSNLAGFYPPSGNDIWKKDLMWQPIPVHTKSEESDELLAAKKSCPEYNRILKTLEHSEEFKKINHKNKELYNYLTEQTGKKIHSVQNVEYIYNDLFIEQLYNFTLPEWTKQVYPDKMKDLAALSFAIPTYTRKLARLKSGPLLKEILERFQNKSTSTLKPNRNLWIYSAHDTTVANLLNTLNLFKQMGYHSPPYRATILLELRKINGNFFVQVFYKNTTADPEPQDIPGCGTLCPLNKMFEIYKDVLPTDWAKECSTSTPTSTLNLVAPLIEADFESSIGMIALISILLLLSVLVLLIAIFYKRRFFGPGSDYHYIDGF